MNRTTRVLGAVVAGTALLCLCAAPAPAADPPGYETYVVRRGDTLSKIAGRVFGDVKRWREIAQKNPQVTNPNKIYPGDSLLVPVAAAPAAAAPLAARPGADQGSEAHGKTVADAGAAVKKTAAEAKPAQPEAKPAAAAPAPVEVKRPPTMVSKTHFLAAGFLADALPALAIIAGEDDRVVLGSDDAAIVNAPVAPGKLFQVVRADRRIFHPRTGASLGWLVRNLGVATATCRGDKTSTVVLQHMRDGAGVGDYLVPIDHEPVPPEMALAERAKPGCVAGGPDDGVIVAFDEDRLTSSEMELAYIDRGTGKGMITGGVYTIYREADPGGPVAIGELQVLRADPGSSVALITTSFQEVQVGDLLRAP